jgi:hypothetical protein
LHDSSEASVQFDIFPFFNQFRETGDQGRAGWYVAERLITGRQANQRCHCMADGGRFDSISYNKVGAAVIKSGRA